MSQDQAQADLIQQNIDEVEGTSVDLKTALEEEKAAAKAEKTAAKDAAKQAKLDEKTAKAEQALVAKQAKLDEKTAKAEALIATKAERLAAKEAKVKAPRVLQETQNGYTKPKDDTNCGKIWALCALLSSEKGELILKKEVTNSPLAIAFHPTTIGVQYYKWKKFHGIV